MTDSHILRRFDINLLLVFDAVFAERSVTRAAGRLAVSQTAISHSLSRLREHLSDQLFVRVANGMQPTPYAYEVAPKIREALDQVEQIVSKSEFNPAESERTFRIGITEYFATLALPSLVAKLQVEAPGAKLITFPHVITNAHALLNNHEIDFAIGYFQDAARDTLAPRLKNTVLLRDSYVCVMRAGHPLTQGELTLERYTEARHLSFSINGETYGPVDRILKRHGVRRQIDMRICHYAAAPAILQNTDLIMTVASRMAEHYCNLYRLELRPGPFANSQPVQLIWNERVHNSVMHQWMRSRIVETCKELPPARDFDVGGAGDSDDQD